MMNRTGLSDQQAQIVLSNAKNIIVDAAAGSGKTRTLTERVRYILECGADPSSIVVITFTNMAADELYSRLSDEPNHKKLFIGTIHSYAHKVLKKTGNNFEIFSELYQTQFMTGLISEYARYCTQADYELFVKYSKMVDAGKLSKSELPTMFSSSKVYKELMYLLGEENNYMYSETVKTLCERNNIITFDELIKLATQHFNETGTHIEYLFVDELQDIGKSEYDFLMSLNASNNFFIGDDFQSIFGFKGGNVDIFLGLMVAKDWTSFYLTENYRTASSILTFANTVIKKAKNIIAKEVVGVRRDQGSLEFQSKSLVESFIQSNVKQDEDWFLLTRTNKEMYYIESILKKLGMEYYCFKQSNISRKKLEEIMSKKCVKVMTVHSSKGLEAENVLLYGKFPIVKTNDDDEYKVFYVGITRAKNRLVVTI